MKILITASEILDKWIWIELCSLKWINEYSIKEGIMSSDQEFLLSEDEAKKIGLIK